MDHKSWLWRKKSTEKMIVASEKVNLSPKENEDEIQTLMTDKAELEKDLKTLNHKLSSALSECNAKDDTVKKQVKMAEEAMAGWEKAEAKAVTLKKELDDALHQTDAADERLTHLDAALKDCMQQLRFVREEQEHRIHDAVMKASTEFEQAKRILEDKLLETSRRIKKIEVENTHLSTSLLAKEKSIEDLAQQKALVEADLNVFMSRLESTEKDNASLKYEVKVLEKELEIRNEEREFNCRTADASHKQHLESVKKIAKLESECQRLRLLVRKRLPGPAALAKMKSEADVLGIDSVERRRRRTSSSANGFIVDSAVDYSLDASTKQVNFLTEQLYAVEEENKSLKEALDRKANELQISRAMYARIASKLSQAEPNLDELSKGRTSFEPSKSGLVPHELSLASMSDVGSDDKISCAESWASALISEMEHFKQGKQRGSPSAKTVGASDISLMDDFVEMERLAIVSVDKQSGSLHIPSNNANATVRPLENSLNGHVPEVTGREIIPVSEIGSGVSNQETESENLLTGKAPGWLQDITKLLLDQARAARKKPDEILEDVRVAMADASQGCPAACFDSKEGSEHLDPSNSPHFGGYISWKPTDKPLLIDSSCGINDDDALLMDRNSQQSDLGKSINKIIELVEGISLPSYGETLISKDGSLFPYKNSETSSDYMVRVFQWKTSELGAVLQKFVHTCYDLLNGKSDVNTFSQELSSCLEWIMNHCFSLQDVSSMRDAIKKHWDWEEAQSESEAEIGMVSQFSEVNKMYVHRKQLCLPVVTAANGLQNSFERGELQYVIKVENKKLKDELSSKEYTKKDLEGMLQSALDKSEFLMNQIQESEQTVVRLQAEVDNLKMSNAMTENQNKNQMPVKDDIDTQLTVTKTELNDARQKLSSFEVELENKNSHCKELGGTCLELQQQHESATKKKVPNQEEEKQLRSDWEITAASEKLAECQETILNLGKQLKALAAPSNTVMFNKVISTSPETNEAAVTRTTSTTSSAPKDKLMSQRSSLLDQMLAEDNAKTKEAKIEESDGNSSVSVSNGVTEPLEKILILNETKHRDDNIAINSLAIAPIKKRGGGNLWRKLLWRKKKSHMKQPPLPVAS